VYRESPGEEIEKGNRASLLNHLRNLGLQVRVGEIICRAGVFRHSYVNHLTYAGAFRKRNVSYRRGVPKGKPISIA